MRQFGLTLAGTRFCALTLVGFWRTTGTAPLRGATAPCCTEPLPLERAGATAPWCTAPLPDECALPDECPLPDEPALPLVADEVLPWPFALSARPLPAAARITARPTTRIFVILTFLAFLIRQHSLVIYSTPLPAIPLDHYSNPRHGFFPSGSSSEREAPLGDHLEWRTPAGPLVDRCFGPIVNER